MFIFGPGVIIGTLPGGTPINVGLANEISFSEKTTIKELHGQYRRALAIGAGTIKTTVKLKNARLSGLALAQLYLGVSPTLGGNYAVIGEAHTLGTIGTPTVTLAPPNSGTFLTDQGVIYTNTGQAFTVASGAPATGSYTVNTTTGVYSFASGDEGAATLISYDYNTSALGQNMTSGNPLLGPTVTISLLINYTDPSTGFHSSLKLFKVVLEGIDLATKLEDFTYPEINGTAYANAAGNAWSWAIPDVNY